MRVRASRMSKLTAILVATILVATMAFSMLAYFGNNQGGNGIISGGESTGAGEVAGAGFSTATPVDKSMLEYNGATVSGSTVTYDTNIKRGSSNGTSFTDKGTWSKFPTNYFKFPTYGKYNFDDMLQNIQNQWISTNQSECDRLIGIEHANSVAEKSNASNVGADWQPNSNKPVHSIVTNHGVAKPNSVSLGKGTYIYDTDTGNDNTKQYGYALYFTMALPDNMVVVGNTTKVNVSFNTRVWAKDRKVGFGYTLVEEVGNVGVNAKLFSGTTDGSNGFNHGGSAGVFSGYKNDPAHSAIWDNNVQSGSNILKSGASNIDQFDGKSGSLNTFVVDDEFTLSEGTRFLRFVFAFNSPGWTGWPTSTQVEVALANLNITLWDSAKGNLEASDELSDPSSDPSNINSDNNVQSTWLSHRYIDLHYNVPNAHLNRKEIMDQLTFSYIDPMTGELAETRPLSQWEKVNLGVIPDSYFFILSDNIGLPLTTKSKFTNLDGTDDTSVTRGFNTSLNIRIGTKLNKYSYNINYETLDVTKSGSLTYNIAKDRTGADKLIKVDGVASPALNAAINFRTKSVRNAAGQYVTRKWDVPTTPQISFTNPLYLTENIDNGISAEKIYCQFGSTDATPYEISIPTYVESQAYDIPTEVLTEANKHGSHDIFIYVQDAVGNKRYVNVMNNNIGKATIRVDQSVIGDVVIKPGAGVNETKWTADDIKLTITATPYDGGVAFMGDIVVFLKKTNKVTQAVTYEKILLNEAGTNSSVKKDYIINNNRYEDITFLALNTVDYSGTSYPSDAAENPNYKKGTVFEKVENNNIFTVRRDNIVPKYSIRVTTTGNNKSNLTADATRHSDNEWKNGTRVYDFLFDEAVNTSPMLFAEKPIIKFRLYDNGNWLDFDASKINLSKNSSFDIGMGEGEFDPGVMMLTATAPQINASNTILKEATNEITSHVGVVSFKVAYPNDPTTFYHYSVVPYANSNMVTSVPTLNAGEVEASKKGNTEHTVKLDNVMPEIDVKYVHTLDEPALEGEGSNMHDPTINAEFFEGSTLPIENGVWFYGKVGIKVTITNFNKMLSYKEMKDTASYHPVTDLFNLSNDPIYCKGAPNEYLKGENGQGGVTSNIDEATQSVNYVTFNRASLTRALGFKIVSGSGKVLEWMPYVDDLGSEFMMNYDNVLPDYTVEDNYGNSIAEGESSKWYNKDVALTFKKSSTKYAGLSLPEYTVNYGGVDNAIDIDTLTTDSYSKEGNYTVTFKATNEAKKSKVVTYTIKIDKTKDIITIKDWLKNHNGDVNYVRGNLNLSASLPIPAKWDGDPQEANGNVKYYYVLSDRSKQLTEAEAINSPNLVEFNFSAKEGAVTASIAGIGNIGPKLVYIVSKDLAGNAAVHQVMNEDGTINNSNLLQAIFDDKDYPVVLDKKGPGSISYTITDNDDTAASPVSAIVSSSTTLTLKSGQKIVIVANGTNVGSKFLGYSNVAGIGGDSNDPLANAEETINISYINDSQENVTNAPIIRNAIFKKYLRDFKITNNNQLEPGGQLTLPVGTYISDINTSNDLDIATAGATFNYQYTGFGLNVKPTGMGTYEYVITLTDEAKKEYWMADFKGSVILTDKAEIIIVFDNTNAKREYEYDGTSFLDNNPTKSLGGKFINDFYVSPENTTETRYSLAQAFNHENTDMAKELQTFLLDPSNWADRLSYFTSTLYKFDGDTQGEAIENAINAGKYKWSMSYTGTQDTPITTIPQFNFKFDLVFTIVPREIVLVANPSATITKEEYDNSKNYTFNPANINAFSWADYIKMSESRVTLEQLAESGLTINTSTSNAVFMDKNVGFVGNKVTISGFSVSNPNYKVKDTSLTYDGIIKPKAVDITYNGTKAYEKEYDATTDVDTKLFAKYGIGEYWNVAGVIDGSKFEIIFDNSDEAHPAIALSGSSVGAANLVIAVDKSKCTLSDTNYFINTIGNIDKNITISRRTIDIFKENDVNEHTKEFDGLQFVSVLGYTNLATPDQQSITAGKGIPTKFYEEEEMAKHSLSIVNDKGDVYGTPGFAWNAGKYTVTFGDASGNVGSSYRLSDGIAFVYEYTITQKEIVITIAKSEVKGDGTFVNTKYYDGLPIGGTQIYSQDNGNDVFGVAPGSQVLDYTVTDKLGNKVKFAAGYTITFIAKDNNINKGKYNIIRNPETDEPVIEGPGRAAENYSPKVAKTVLTYNILPRPILVSPKDAQDTVGYTGKEQYMININGFANADVMLCDENGGNKVAIDTVPTIASYLSNPNLIYNLDYVIMNGNAVATGANLALGADKAAASTEYKFAITKESIEKSEIGDNFIIMVDSAKLAYIRQAEYYIQIGSYDIDNIYNDVKLNDSLINLNDRGTYTTYAKDGSTQVNILGLKLAIFKIENKAGAITPVQLNESNYGVGKYEIRIIAGDVLTDDYKIMNIPYGSVGEVLDDKPLYKIGQDVNGLKKLDEKHSFNVVPATITITSNASIKSTPYGLLSYADLANLLIIDAPNVRIQANRDKFENPLHADSLLKLKKVAKSGPDTEINLKSVNANDQLDAGEYYFDYTNLEANMGDNFLVVPGGRIVYTITQTKVYVSFEGVALNKIYDGTNATVAERTEFFNEHGGKVGALDGNRVRFNVIDNTTLGATAKAGTGYSIVPVQEDVDAINNGNYFLDAAHPFLNGVNYKYSISKRDLLITLDANPYMFDTRPEEVVYGKKYQSAAALKYNEDHKLDTDFVEKKPIPFSMKSAFVQGVDKAIYTILTADTTTGFVGDYTAVETAIKKVMDAAGVQVRLTNNNPTYSVFTVTFTGVNFIESSFDNYIVKLDEVDSIVVHKAVISQTIKKKVPGPALEPLTYANNKYTYGVDVINVDKFGIEYASSYGEPAEALLTHDEIKALFDKEPAVIIDDGVEATSGVDFTLSISKDYAWKAERNDLIDYSQAYLLDFEYTEVPSTDGVTRKINVIQAEREFTFAPEFNYSIVNGDTGSQSAFPKYANYGDGALDPKNGKPGVSYKLSSGSPLATNDSILISNDYIVTMLEADTTGKIDGVVIPDGFMVFRIAFDYQIMHFENDKYTNVTKFYKVTFPAENDVKEEMSGAIPTGRHYIDVLIKKAEATITIGKKAGRPDTLTYSKDFFKNFEGSVNGVFEFDKKAYGTIEIKPESMTFSSVESFDADTTIATITFDRTMINKNALDALNTYYKVTISDLVDYKFTKATIVFRQKGDVVTKKYGIDNVKTTLDKYKNVVEPTLGVSSWNLEQVVSPRDYKYIFKNYKEGNNLNDIPQTTDALMYAKTGEDYTINILDYNENPYKSTNGPTLPDTVYTEYVFVPNSDLFFTTDSHALTPPATTTSAGIDIPYVNNKLFMFDMAFDIQIDKCPITVEFMYPNVEKPDGSHERGTYEYTYGTPTADISTDIATNAAMRIVANNTDGTEVIISDPAVLDTIVSVDTTGFSTKPLYVVGNYVEAVVFDLLPGATNYKFATAINPEGTKANGSVEFGITAKEVYFYAHKAGEANENLESVVLFSNVFGENGKVLPDEQRAFFKTDRSAFTIVWYTKNELGEYSIISDVVPNQDKVDFAVNKYNYFAGSYPMTASCSDANFIMKMRPQLDGNKAKVVEKKEVPVNYKYDITMRTVTFNAEVINNLVAHPVENDPFVYGITYGEVKNRLLPREGAGKVDRGLFAGWSSLDDVVRNEIRSKIAVVLTDGGNPIATLNDKLVDAKDGYGVKYVANYDISVINSIEFEDLAVTLDIKKADMAKQFRADGADYSKNKIVSYNGKTYSGSVNPTMDSKSRFTMNDFVLTVNGELLTKDKLTGKYSVDITNAGVYNIGVVDALAITYDPTGVNAPVINASNNFAGEYTYTITVEELDLSKIITNNDLNEHYTYTGSALDSKVSPKFDTSIVGSGINALINNNDIIISIDGQTINNSTPTTFIVDYKADGYVITMTTLKPNFIGTKSYKVFVDKRFISAFNVDDGQQHDKEYGNMTHVVPTSNVPKDAYTRTYSHNGVAFDVAEDKFGKIFKVAGAELVNIDTGIYAVEFAPTANYDFKPYKYTFQIVPKNIDSYVNSGAKVIVTASGDSKNIASVNGNVFNAKYRVGGIDILVNSVSEIFKEYKNDILSVKVKVFEDKNELYQIGNTIDYKVTPGNVNDNISIMTNAKSGVCYISLQFETSTNDNNNHNLIAKNHQFKVVIDRINIDDKQDAGSVDANGKIEINDKTETECKKHEFVFDASNMSEEDKKLGVAKVPTINLTINENGKNSPLNIDGSKTKYYKFADNRWTNYDASPCLVGHYMAVFTIDDDNIVGEKRVEFEIKPVEVKFEFKADNLTTKPYDTTPFAITYTNNDTYVNINYYSVNGKNETLLKGAPTNAGKYIVKAELNPMFAAKDGVDNVIIKPVTPLAEGKEMVKEHAFTITKIDFADKGNIEYAKYNDAKVYDGKTLSLDINPNFFTGLPEGAELSIDTADCLNVGKHNLVISVDSTNFKNFTLDYGTYEITKAKYIPEVSSKEAKAISFKNLKYPGLKVEYIINDKNAVVERDDISGLKPNTKYDITIKLSGTAANNFEEQEIKYSFTTARNNSLSTEQIVAIAGAVGVVVAVGVLLGIVKGIRKKRKL